MHVRKQVMVMPQHPPGGLLALAVVATMSVVVAVAPPPNIVFILADGETMHSSLGATANHFLIVLFTYHRCVHTTPAHCVFACWIRMPPSIHLAHSVASRACVHVSHLNCVLYLRSPLHGPWACIHIL